MYLSLSRHWLKEEYICEIVESFSRADVKENGDHFQQQLIDGVTISWVVFAAWEAVVSTFSFSLTSILCLHNTRIRNRSCIHQRMYACLSSLSNAKKILSENGRFEVESYYLVLILEASIRERGEARLLIKSRIAAIWSLTPLLIE